MVPVFRFAPSPNGYLHLGHALSALLNAEMARVTGGRLLLRIEDIDDTRCRPEFEKAIFEDLNWLGLAFEQPMRRQTDHLDDYRAAIARLDALGLVYPSFESRTEIARLVAEREARGPWPRDPDDAPLYPGTCKTLPAAERARRLAAGEPCALRLDMKAAVARAGDFLSLPPPWRGRSASEVSREGGKQQIAAQVTTPLPNPPPQGGREQTSAIGHRLVWSETGVGPNGETGTIAAAPQAWGDVVLARKDTPTSYHLSVVIDDAAQGVTDVVRGEDLFWSTSVHRLLQVLLDLPPPAYHHHRLILGPDGRKLSKSTRATALRELRAQGMTPADIRRMVGPV